MTTYTGLGLTSGSSLDGLDICCAEFTGDLNTDIWSFRILEATTVPYDDAWRERLANVHTLSGLELIRLHYDYAHFMGKAIEDFMVRMAEKDKDLPGGKLDIRVDFVAANGHTAFHQPENGVTFQLGDGEVLSTYLKCPLITNFSVKDVCLGGQGAPLAGSVDRFLFLGVGLCINLGGIACIRVRETGSAWDVCACNTVLNHLANLKDPTAMFDKNGELAEKGKVLKDVLKSLEELDYYKLKSPKSLAMEWITNKIWPILDTKKYSLEDLARTYVEHIAMQICDACMKSKASPDKPRKTYGENVVLLTGGGVHNTFLMKNVKEKLLAGGLHLDKDMAEPETIDFKEAASFAFLGMRCMLGKANVFADSTGASESSTSGCIHQPLRIDFRGSYPSTYRFLFRQASVSS
ncbi:anhydro-N-acetylmuramic acid kinase-like isoform X2 [Babylonia areolata]|uniref:anhydro-N-acetylmuramic acid kinase-like isoform X2 n=1 Tax=Babylonia areolata TaxID=304850 RepID=UPI003FD570B7